MEGLRSNEPTRHRLGLVLAGTALLLAGLAITVQVLGPRGGVGALVAIATPHLLLIAVGLALIGVLVCRSRGALACALVVAVGAAGLMGPDWMSLPAQGDAASFVVMTWNLELGSEAAAQLPAALASTDADIVALQELTPKQPQP